VSMMGAGLRPSGKPLDWPPYPKMQSAPHFYPDHIDPESCAVSREGIGVEHRIGDKRIIRLIRKWLKAGVLEDGVVTVSEMGTGQGSVISPLLANIYMHYVFDLWANRWRRREAQGDVVIVRFADDCAPRRREEEVAM
jgi:Reverse transcriptase (RNA-dependent DNA polymerase)